MNLLVRCRSYRLPYFGNVACIRGIAPSFGRSDDLRTESGVTNPLGFIDGSKYGPCGDIGGAQPCCLINLSERMGTSQADGSMKMAHFTHELLAEGIGTSREIVSYHMSQFRKQGYLQYSRKGIVLYREAFDNWMREPSQKRADFASNEPKHPRRTANLTE